MPSGRVFQEAMRHGPAFAWEAGVAALIIGFLTGLAIGPGRPGVSPGSGTVKAMAVSRASTVVKLGGRMTGGGSIFTDDSLRVTHGFELYCDANRKPNHLEINWHPGSAVSSQFHLETLTVAECTDDPTISPSQPAAPFDTHAGKGTGRYNRQSGATAEWIFTDAGEPGTSDRIKKLVIRDAGGNVVLSVPEPGKTLTHGNHQAHR